MQIGDSVTYVDEVRVTHDALITAVHGSECINLIYVSTEELKADPYGRQIERASSVQRENPGVTAHGRYFNEK